MAIHYFRTFSRPRRVTTFGLSRGLRNQSRFELPRDERDYTGNVWAGQENVANITIIFRPGLGAPV